MKRKISIASVVVGILTYSYIVFYAAKGTGEGLSFSTFALWAVLAWITSLTIMKQGANPAIPVIYGLGSTATSIALLTKGKYSWSHFDSLIAALVIMCVIFWLTRGVKFAFILSIISGVIASFPYLIMAWKSPLPSTTLSNLGFLITSMLALIATRSWTVKDCLYNGVNVVMCSLFIVPWLIWK